MKLITVIALAIFSNMIQAATAQLAARIVELRADVETLNSEYLANKEELTNKLKAKGTQIAQLESQIGQEEVRKKQAQEKIAAIKSQLKKLGAREHNLGPFVLSKVELVKEYVSKSLPFKKEKRISELENIKGKLSGGVITSQSALSRLWAFLEDEMRLTRENALHRQTIQLGGEERLATVAKIGMMLLYFHTIDNKVGYIKRDEQGVYKYIEETQKERKEQIFTLIDGLRKQIRYGRYVLPLAMN